MGMPIFARLNEKIQRCPNFGCVSNPVSVWLLEMVRSTSSLWIRSSIQVVRPLLVSGAIGAGSYA